MRQQEDGREKSAQGLSASCVSEEYDKVAVVCHVCRGREGFRAEVFGGYTYMYMYLGESALYLECKGYSPMAIWLSLEFIVRF